MTVLDIVHLALLIAAVVVLVTRLPILPLEWALGACGVGGVDSTIATAQLLCTASAWGLIAGRLVHAPDALATATIIATGIAAGIAVAWLGSSLEPRDDPPGW